MTEQHPFDRLWVIQLERQKWISQESKLEHNAPNWSGIVFVCAKTEWAVSIRDIHEIVFLPQLTPVPNVKPWLKGIFNLRGELLAVTDLAELMTHEATILSRNSRVLACRYEEEWVGILVERIVTLIYVLESDLKIIETESINVGFRDFVEKGILFKGKMLPILQIKRALSIDTGMVD